MSLVGHIRVLVLHGDPVAQAEAHLEETDLSEDRDTLKKIQAQM